MLLHSRSSYIITFNYTVQSYQIR